MSLLLTMVTCSPVQTLVGKLMFEHLWQPRCCSVGPPDGAWETPALCRRAGGGQS